MLNFAPTATGPWVDFAPTVLAGIISGLFSGLVTGLFVGWILNRGQRAATTAALDRDYDLQWQSMRSAVLLAVGVNDTPNSADPTQPTAAQARMDSAIGNYPVRVWAAHLKSTEINALIDLLNAWDRRSLSQGPASSAMWVKIARSGPDNGTSLGMWGLMMNAWNNGNLVADKVWELSTKDPEFMTVVDKFRADCMRVHGARNQLEKVLTTRSPE